MGKKIFDPSSVSIEMFFQDGQSGDGFYFAGTPFQRGYGFGGMFRSLLRSAKPWLKAAGKDVGKEAMISTGRILDNIAHGADVKDTLIEEAKQGVKRAVKRIGQRGGSGIPKKKRKTTKRRKSPKKRAGGKKKRVVVSSLIGKRIPKSIAILKPKTKLGFY